MPNYELQQNEAVILKAENVMQGEVRFGASFTDDLVLTNRNLIWISKGTFGRTKRVEHFPLSHIKVVDDVAQVLVTKARNGRPALEVYLHASQEVFQFFAQTNGGAKKEAQKWAEAIQRAATGQTALSQKAPSGALPGSEMLAKTLGATLGQFKSALGGSAEPATPVRVSATCSACGAPVSGFRGNSARCEYCGTSNMLV